MKNTLNVTYIITELIHIYHLHELYQSMRFLQKRVMTAKLNVKQSKNATNIADYHIV